MQANKVMRSGEAFWLLGTELFPVMRVDFWAKNEDETREINLLTGLIRKIKYLRCK